jgi:hypothetical protein
MKDYVTCVPFYNICNGASKHLQALWHLQSDHLGIVLANVMDGFMDLERVIGGELQNSSVQLGILQYLCWNLVH